MIKEKLTSKWNNLSKNFSEWFFIYGSQQNSFLNYIIVFLVLMVAILSIESRGIYSNITVGKPAPETIRSPREFSFVDKRKTDELIETEKAKVLPVYVPINGRSQQNIMDKFNERFDKLLEFYEDYSKLNKTATPTELLASYSAFDMLLDDESLLQIHHLRGYHLERLKSECEFLISKYSSQPIALNNIDSVRKEIKEQVDNYHGNSLIKKIMTSIVINSLTINSEEKTEETEKKRIEAANSVLPVVISFQKGQKIIEEGSIVSEDDFIVIKKLTEEVNKNRFLSILGYVLLSLLTLNISLVFLKIERKSFLGEIEKYKLLGVLFLLGLLLCRLILFFTSSSNSGLFSLLFSPLPTIAIIMSVFLDCTVAAFHIFLLGIVTITVSGSGYNFVLVSIFGAISTVIVWNLMPKGNERKKIGDLGTKIGIANMVSIVCLLLIDNELDSTISYEDITLRIGAGLINGYLSGIIANGILEQIEKKFSVTTATMLNAFAEPTYPLLRTLASKANGTYMHSVAVATLAEAGAAAINADTLKTKIAAYYHDVGKINRPQYFTENQLPGENPHDTLTPYMSAMILKGHVRDGIDIAREYKIPEDVLSIMSQHHGTTIIKFFYDKAVKEAEKQGTSDVDQEKFKYLGPKPQSKEAAILMLADAIEASSKSITDYSYDKFEELVNKRIDEKHNQEQQFEECGITLSEINMLKEVFIKTLMSMYHGRIKYPEQIKEEAKEQQKEQNKPEVKEQVTISNEQSKEDKEVSKEKTDEDSLKEKDDENTNKQ